MPAWVDPDSVRGTLRKLGARRKRQTSARETLVEDTRDALREARDAGISMTEAADLLNIDRAVIYQHYGGGTRRED